MLNLSSKGRYATRIMVYLALRREGGPAKKSEIGRAEEISEDYVEQILIKLKSAGLVASHRGAGGGFSLARDPRRISVADVLAATEGPPDLAPCLKDRCRRRTYCVTRRVWEEAGAALQRIFAGTTIADLAEQAGKLRQSNSAMYEI